jgi:hypothetical protein
MQVTKRQLKNIILEELQFLVEEDANELVELLQGAQPELLEALSAHISNPQVISHAIQVVAASSGKNA